MDFEERLAVELRALREEMVRLAGRPAQSLPLLLTLKMAARELSISPSTLKQRIRAGHVLVSHLGGKRMVSLAEIHRICRPVERPRPKSRGGRRPAPKKTKKTGEEHEAFVRAALKKR